MKKFTIILLLAAAAMLIVTGCSTVPLGKFSATYVVDKILGPVPRGDYSNYTEAFEAAKKVYPNAEAVIILKAIGGNKILPWTVDMGYFAVTLKPI
jgi:hypothetical protein